MTNTNIVLAAAAVVLGAGCLVLFTDDGGQRNRVRVLEAQVAQLQRELTAATTAPEPVTPDPVAPTSERPAQVAAPPAVPPGPPAVAKPAADENREWRAVLADPAYRRVRIEYFRQQLRREHAQVVAEMGLSPEETERFLDLLAEQSVRENERAMKQQSGQDYARWKSEIDAQAEKERRAFLGEERFRTWTEYVKSTQARALVSELRTQLATTDSPLREEQVKPFVKALASEHERHHAERKENYEAETGRNGQWTEETPADQQIEYMERRAALIQASLDRQQEAAEIYLDSTQQREFKGMLDRRREQVRIEVESFRAQLEAAARVRSRSR
jgi:hypothetical protein